MSLNRSFSRRQFIQGAAAVGAVAPFILPSRVWGAEIAPSKKITVGFIGVGTQGRYLLGGFLGADQAQVVAVCDVDTTRREAAKKQVEEHYTVKKKIEYKGCDQYADFRQLLERKDIDAVCIATPDHWHAIPAMQACAAKKDVYCEKPLSLNITEARAMANAARKHNVVFQTGSMQRSSKEFLKACEIVRNGMIGKISQVVVDVGGPSKWCDLPEEAAEPGLDWDMWLGPSPKRAYNSVLSPRGIHKHFPAWRNYREYSGGMMTDWGAHHFDITQWGLGMDDSGPVEIIPPEDPKANKGLRYIYANGVEVLHGNSGGVLFIGDKGKVFVNRGKLKTEPDEKLGLEYVPGTQPIKLYASTNQIKDFLSCVVSRKRPICDVEIGCRSATVCHLGNLAYWNRRKLKWDPKAERFVGDAEANKWLGRENRAPWTMA